GKSVFHGLRDYNPIASSICRLTNTSTEVAQVVHGIGYGSYIITVQHLFRVNNGTLKVQSRHGEFICQNTTQLKMFSCEERDVLIIQMPKDFPPFPTKLQFRAPKAGESVVMVGGNFQQKSFSSMVSEVSQISQRETTHYWKHFISTKKGDCGFPLVSTVDGSIVGIHTLEAIQCSYNYFTSVPENFKAGYLDNAEAHEWTKNWSFNVKNIGYGSLKIVREVPSGMFHPAKLVSDLADETVREQ
nr:Nia-Pro [Ashitaba mosaic virus]